MEVIDNNASRLGDNLRATLQRGDRVRCIAPVFSIYAYAALKDELDEVERFEFVFSGPSLVTDGSGGAPQHRQFMIPQAMRPRDLSGTPFEIRLRNRMTGRAAAQDCAHWIRSKARFKASVIGGGLPHFLSVEGAARLTTYANLSGFTASDLGYEPSGGLTMITKFDDRAAGDRYQQVFGQLWEDRSKLADVTEALCQHIEATYAENAPARIYHLILASIFRTFLNEVSEDTLPNDLIGYRDTKVWKTLYKFQQDAVVGLINKLETFNGCILADSVGLGKTLTALAVIKYYELRNKSVLVLCPKKLSENWRTYNRNLTTNILHEDRLRYDVLAHTDLTRTGGESMGMPLNQVNWGNYDLVVIDESHNFRNDNATEEDGETSTRYRALLNKVIRAGVRTKVLMLSATPVNNRFSDLRNQLALAYEGDSAQLSAKLKGVHTVEETFRRAQRAFNEWQDLPVTERTPEAIQGRLDFDFFELLDAVTIARSRRHITTHYDTTEIGRFPDRLPPKAFRSPLTDLEGAPSFEEIYGRLSDLTLAVYAPLTYVLPSRAAAYGERYDTPTATNTLRQQDREASIKSLMRVNLLKRLESSVASFRITLQNLLSQHRGTLEAIAAFERGEGGGLSLADAEDEDDFVSVNTSLRRGDVEVAFADLDLLTYKRELQADETLLAALLADMEAISPEHDAKLRHALDYVASKAQAPLNEGNRKVLIFTAFADTAEYLYRELGQAIHARDGRHAACVTGSGGPRTTLGTGIAFNDVLTLFSPGSKKADLLMPDEHRRVDVLIATDCISEGQNLQDCDVVVNYDIHWNPVRIIQRFGRVDRIGSPNERIQLVNYWPDISLDDYINLKDRVENRMVIADMTATGDDNPLNQKAGDMAYRRDQLRRLQDEVIEPEDIRQGVSITDLGLNDFRMDLVSYTRTHGTLDDAPLGMHAIVPAAESRPPGVMFCLRNLNAGDELSGHNRLHPHYLVYVRTDGSAHVRHTDPKRMLDLLRGAAKGRTEPDPELFGPFNQETDDGRRMEAYSALLGDAVRSMVEAKTGRDVDSLFADGPTTALVGDVAGVDDFELIAFVVVRDRA